MDFWQAVSFVPVDELGAIAREAEAAGFTGLAIPDHLLIPLEVGSRYPYAPDAEIVWDPTSPFPEPLALACMLGACTTRLRFMTYVYILPLRDPFTAAKGISTAAVLTQNRTVLGVGAGWMEDEFRAVGASFHDRGRRFDDMLVVTRKLLSGRPVEHHSEHYDFPPVQMSPAPTAPVPVWVGGHSEAALRRAARHDGWLGVNYDEADIGPILERLHALRADAPRSATPFSVTLSTNAPLDVELCRRLSGQGVTGIVIPTWLGDEAQAPIAQKLARIRRIGTEVIGPVNQRE
jgi:probable F420-dependent oxidoreductase